jgi:hypothetical protein
MRFTARGAAVFSGLVLGGFGAWGLLVTPHSAGESNFLLASWLPPITLFPAAALAAALDADMPRGVRGQLSVLWPAYAGLVLYAAVSGVRWLEASSRGTHENFAALFLFVVVAIHAAVFIVGGGLLALFARTRPAGFQMWLAYPVLLVSWVAGTFLLDQ